MKKPMLILGILLFGLFITQETTRSWWAKFRGRYIPNTCTSVKDRVDPKIPKNWQIACPGTENLELTIIVNNEMEVNRKLLSELYKILANSYVQFAKMSNPETLETLLNVNIYIDHPKLKIASKARGIDVVKFMNFKSKEDISLGLRKYVKVREIPK